MVLPVEATYRLLVLLVLLLVTASLLQGIYFLVHDSGRPGRTRVVKALTARLLFAILLFLLLIAGKYFGLL